MTTLADIVAAHGGAYLAEFGAKLLPSHRRALTDITACRTEIMGGHVSQCEGCGHQQYVYHSCRNRSCPKCHGAETGVWLEKREAELLPVRYFHLVFTLPAELRDPVRRNQKTMYGILMQTAADVLVQRDLDFQAVCDKPSRTEESRCARSVTITPQKKRFQS